MRLAPFTSLRRFRCLGLHPSPRSKVNFPYESQQLPYESQLLRASQLASTMLISHNFFWIRFAEIKSPTNPSSYPLLFLTERKVDGFVCELTSAKRLEWHFVWDEYGSQHERAERLKLHMQPCLNSNGNCYGRGGFGAMAYICRNWDSTVQPWCSSSEAGSYEKKKLTDFMCHSTLGLRVTKKKKNKILKICPTMRQHETGYACDISHALRREEWGASTYEIRFDLNFEKQWNLPHLFF